MTSWENLQKTLAFEFERVRRMVVVDFGYAKNPIYDLTLLQAEETESSDRLLPLIRNFCASRKWLPMSDQDRYFLRQRLLFAHEFVTLALISTKRPEQLIPSVSGKLTESDALAWLLVDLWRGAGCKTWLSPLKKIFGADPAPSAPDAHHLALSQ